MGVNIPIAGNEQKDKVFYGWFDNHFIIYLHSLDCYKALIRQEKNGIIPKYIILLEKDIVYHHYLFLPAIRFGINQEYKLPDFIPTRGHLMLQNNKISKSRNWYIGLREFVNLFQADYLRFYISSICSYSQDDINFDWNDFEKKINNELIANIGNFVNRTLTFIGKNFGNVIPNPSEYDEIG